MLSRQGIQEYQVVRHTFLCSFDDVITTQFFRCSKCATLKKKIVLTSDRQGRRNWQNYAVRHFVAGLSPVWKLSRMYGAVWRATKFWGVVFWCGSNCNGVSWEEFTPCDGDHMRNWEYLMRNLINSKTWPGKKGGHFLFSEPKPKISTVVDPWPWIGRFLLAAKPTNPILAYLPSQILLMPLLLYIPRFS